MNENHFSAPTLKNMDIASPCSASWEDMNGDDRTRHCSSCTKNVYNLSEMSSAEANALIAEKEGRLCVRIYRRPDGTVLTDDCPVGLRAIRAGYRKVATAAASFLALLIAGSAVLAGDGKAASDKLAGKCVKQADEPRATMGRVAAPQPFMGEIMQLPTVTKGEAWIPKFQKSVEDQLKASLGSKVKAPLVQFYLTIGQDGLVVSFTTIGHAINEDDGKTLEAVRQMKFKEFPKETKFKQVTLHAKLAGTRSD